MLVRPGAALVFPPRGNRRGAIEIAKLDIEIVRERLEVLLPEEWRRPGDVACVGLLDGERAG